MGTGNTPLMPFRTGSAPTRGQDLSGDGPAQSRSRRPDTESSGPRGDRPSGPAPAIALPTQEDASPRPRVPHLEGDRENRGLLAVDSGRCQAVGRLCARMEHLSLARDIDVGLPADAPGWPFFGLVPTEVTLSRFGLW